MSGNQTMCKQNYPRTTDHGRDICIRLPHYDRFRYPSVWSRKPIEILIIIKIRFFLGFQLFFPEKHWESRKIINLNSYHSCLNINMKLVTVVRNFSIFITVDQKNLTERTATLHRETRKNHRTARDKKQRILCLVFLSNYSVCVCVCLLNYDNTTYKRTALDLPASNLTNNRHT